LPRCLEEISDDIGLFFDKFIERDVWGGSDASHLPVWDLGCALHLATAMALFDA
jgi:hypothetical protein